MATNGDPVLGDKVAKLKARLDEITFEIDKLEAQTTLSASQQQERARLGQEQAQVTADYIEARQQYLATVPEGEAPRPVETGETDYTSSYADVATAVANRDTAAVDWNQTTANQQVAEDQRASIVNSAAEGGRELTIDEERQLAAINLGIANERATQDALRSQIQSETEKMNTANADLSSNNNASPRTITETTYNEDGTVNIPPQSQRWGSDIANIQTENSTNIQVGNIVLKTDVELTEERQETYRVLNSEIDERVQENNRLQAQIEKDQEILEIVKDTPGTTSRTVENRIARNKKQQALNETFITSREQSLDQMRTTDLQRQFAKDDSILDDAKRQRQKAIDDRWQANQDINQSRAELNQELQKENPDPARVKELTQEVEDNTSRYSVAQSQIDDSERNISEISKLRTNPDYFSQRLNESNNVTINTPPIPPKDQPYGSVDASDRQEWNDGTTTKPSQLWDTETGQYIDPSDIQDYEGSNLDNDRYVHIRDGVDGDEIDEELNEDLANINKLQSNDESLINQSYDQQEKVQLDQLRQNPEYIANEKEAEKKRALAANRQAELDKTNALLENETDLEERKRLQKLKEQQENEINNAKSAADKAEKNNRQAEEKIGNDLNNQRIAELSKTQAIYDKDRAATNIEALRKNNPNQKPVSDTEASALVQQRQIAKENESRKEANLERARYAAQQRCRATSPNGTDCSKKENWSKPDQDRVDSAANDLDKARKDLQDNNNRIASASAAPNGEEALLNAGITDEELTQAQAEAFGDPPGRTDTATSPTGNDSGDTIRPQNVGRTPTGFESINEGAPFYFQMPTLTSITDFRMSNGYSPYGPRDKDSIARDAVHFNIFELNPATSRPVISADGNTVQNEVQDQGANTIGSFTIYPNDPNWLSLNHNHTWGGGPVSKIAEFGQTVAGLLDGGQALLQALNTIGNSRATGEEAASPRRISRKIDTIDTYQSTAPLELTLPFVLFTKKDFLADVYRPLMFLTALTYPKRLVGGNIQGDLKQLSKNLENEASRQRAAGNTGTAEVAQFAAETTNSNGVAGKAGNFVGGLDESSARTGGFGPFRYFVSQRPEYLSMRHASGLMYFPVCYIQSIDYKFLGPWYNYDGTRIDTNATPGGQIAAEQSFRQVLESGQFDPSNPRRKLPAAYPSMAEVRITVKNAMPFFRDDWMQLFNGANDPQELINVSVKQTGQGDLITPNGRAVRPLAGLNDTQKDLFERRPPESGKPAAEQDGRAKGGSKGASTAKTGTENQDAVKDEQKKKTDQAKTSPAGSASQAQDPGPASDDPAGTPPEPPPELPPEKKSLWEQAKSGASSAMATAQEYKGKIDSAIQSPFTGDLVDTATGYLSDGINSIADPIRQTEFAKNVDGYTKAIADVEFFQTSQIEIAELEVASTSSTDLVTDSNGNSIPSIQTQTTNPAAISDKSNLSPEVQHELDGINAELNDLSLVEHNLRVQSLDNDCDESTSDLCKDTNRQLKETEAKHTELLNKWHLLTGTNFPE